MIQMKGLLGGLLVVSLGLVAAMFFSQAKQDPSNPRESIRMPVARETHRMAGPETAVPNADTPMADHTPDMPEMIESLIDLFGSHIDHPRVQMEALEHLIRHLKTIYPDTWRDHLGAWLFQAFPEYAPVLLERFEQLAAYSDWMNGNREWMATLAPDELRELLWEKRLEIFGDEALTIWEMELKKNEVDRLAADIDAMAGAPFEEKLNHFNQTFDGIYGDMAPAYRKNHPQNLMNTFLGIDSVQDDLHTMTPETRTASLTDLRKAMGLDEAALTRWSDLDQQRNERWRSGLAYMKARDALLAAPDTDGRDTELAELRRKHFGTEADIIAAEEASGLFRFTRKRLYGKN
jgi:hypothetical protein